MNVQIDFPALAGSHAGVCYLDSAATTLKPRCVIDAVGWFLQEGTSAVHRGIHPRSLTATDRFESTRERIAEWFLADAEEVVLTSGATDAIHLVRCGLRDLNSVVYTVMEHHSNYVPWMDVANHHCLGVDGDGQIDLETLGEQLRGGVDLVAITHQSNVLGSITRLEEIVELTHRHGAMILVDAAQSAAHDPPDFGGLGIDFLACSAHKMLGPSGSGALLVARHVQDRLRPVRFGGNMVSAVHGETFELQSPPHCFEAGTPAIESVIGWGAAIDYLDQLSPAGISHYLSELTDRAANQLAAIDGVRLVSTSDPHRGPLVAFTIEGMEANAVVKILGNDQIFLRAGYHCAQPLHEHLGMGPSIRASFQVYNTPADIDRLTERIASLARVAG
ncbi:aminotransferase class V-fold PLP-dependent enzyme [Roseiconus lacunae]|uniref:aminotransferase class V-fold PLP-dependent enzyme n=1 Tax=Roseiconus lacunae TaxID=2605694 RepID=UPI001E3EA3BB|nr:aminotransferase class V-fold PLP-dependent enzyme [Roseiconus lacunae]MCD0458894.1 aminotransferase class V-fold PLP-dependent enzyme [Roseiconus lacunae]